eukprot:63829_1
MSSKRRKPITEGTETPLAKRRKTTATNNAIHLNHSNNNNGNNKHQYEDKTLPRFLQHIWTMLHDSTLRHIISWHDTMPNAFVVHKQTAFCQEILPKFFKHNKFTSFVRQLNMYQFHKLRDEKPMTWSHQYLHKNKYSQLQFIQRRISSSASNNAHSATHLQCNNNYKNIIRMTSENKQNIVALQEEIKQIRNDINLKFNQLRQDLMAKFDTLYRQNLNQEMHQNMSMGMRLRHAPPLIANANVKEEQEEQKKREREMHRQRQMQIQPPSQQPPTSLESDSPSTNNSINITRYVNNRNNTMNSNHNTNAVQTPSSVVYVTNGAAQCLPLELIGTTQGAASNASPYIITSNAGSPATITLLNIGANNLPSRTPPSCNTFAADFPYNNHHYNYNNLQ